MTKSSRSVLYTFFTLVLIIVLTLCFYERQVYLHTKPILKLPEPASTIGYAQNLDNNNTSLVWDLKNNITWSEYYEDIFKKYHVPVMTQAYPEVSCNATNTTFTENMEILSKYQFTVPSRYLKLLSLDPSGINELSKPVPHPAKYPIFVTAASSNHYKESMNMIKNYTQFLSVHPDLKMIFFDIGLSASEHAAIKKYCKCEMRTYDFGKYPKHIADLMGYTWKPIIIQTVLKEHDFVFWMDASVRFKGKPLDELSRRARQRGLQFFFGGGGAVMQRTSKVTFDFLKETPCIFNFPEAKATTFVISRNRFTLEYFMKPLVLCALSENCMTYTNSIADLYCYGKVKIHDCHRFDQSVMGILTTRLFREKRRLLEYDLEPVITIQRECHVWEDIAAVVLGVTILLMLGYVMKRNLFSCPSPLSEKNADTSL